MSEKQPESTNSRSLNKLRRWLMLGPCFVLLLGGGYFYLNSGRYVETDNAYLKSDKIPLSTEVAGQVVALYVKENVPVKAGQALFEIDPAAYQVALQKAQANLANIRTTISALKAQYQQVESQIALQNTNYAYAQKAYKRQAELAERHFVSASGVDDSKQAVDVASQQLVVLRNQLEQLKQNLVGDPTIAVDEHPQVKAALAEVAQAKLDLAHTHITAPDSGVVSQLPKLGQHLAVGAQALALISDKSVWVEANYNETDLTHVKLGQSVNIHVDTYPDWEGKGIVESISPATGAEFSVLPAQNSTGNWVKVIQRIPVRIRINTSLNQPELRTGMSAIVDIDTEHRRHVPGMAWAQQ